jgi:hypothetical protein
MPRVINAWKPPGHDDGENVVVGLSSLVDPQDPALKEIIGVVMELRVLGVTLTEELVQKAVSRGRHLHQVSCDAKAQVPLRLPVTITAETREAAAGSVVYYMRIGNRIKIGFSTNLTERLKAINPEELMAFELGGRKLEMARHSQFAQSRVNGEWFKYEGPLAEHVRELQDSLRAAS